MASKAGKNISNITQNFVNVKVALTAQNFKVYLHWQSELGYNHNVILPPLLGLAFLGSTTQKDLFEECGHGK